MALVGWWKLDGDALDSSGNGNHGTIQGSPSVVSGKIGQAYDLTLDTERINQTSNNFNLTFNHNFTVSFWYKLHALGGLQRGILTYSNAGAANKSLHITVRNTGMMAFAFYGNDYNSNYLVPENQWVHYTMVGDRENLLQKIYVNGTLWGERQTTSWLDLTDPSTLILGYYSTGCNGMLDDFRIYDHALSDKEVKELAKAKVLHYKFDDFQEPTENIIHFQNPRIDASYNPYVATTSGTWQEKHPDALRVYNKLGSEITAYVNTGVTDWTNTYHAIWVFDTILNSPVVVMRDIDGAWKAKSFGMGHSMTSLGLVAGDKYTISWLQWVEDITKSAVTGVYGQNTSGVNGFHDGMSDAQPSSKNTLPNTWQRVSATFTVNEIRNMSSSLNIYMYGHYSPRGTLKIADVQFEKKPYATSFFDGIRTGTVLDTSGYNHHAELALATTPRWTEESRLGSGAYEFDGVVTRIETPHDETLSLEHFTISLWAKPKTLPQYSTFISKGSGGDATNWNYSLWAYANGNLHLFVGSGVASGHQTVSYNISSLINTWVHIVGRVDGDHLKLYVNGQLVASTVQTIIPVNNTLSVSIGRTTDTGYHADAFVDDVRIYATALSDADVLELYQTRASLDDNGNWEAQEIRERYNFLNPDLFYKYVNNPTTQTSGEGVIVDGRRTWRVYPAWFHPNKALHGLFKPNTQYKICTVTKHDTIHLDVYRPGGFILNYTDASVTYVTTTGGTGEWIKTEVISSPNKTIASVSVYYYTSFEVLIDIDESYMVEHIPQGMIDEKGIIDSRIISEVGPTDGLIGYWPMNGDVNDYSLSNLTTQVTNEAYVAGQGQLAINLQTASVVIPEPERTNLSSYTYTFWVKLKVGYTGLWRKFLERNGSGAHGSTDRSPGLWWYSTLDGIHVQQRMGDNTVQGGADITTGFSLNQWHHVAIRCDYNGASTVLSSFLDGAIKASNTYALAPYTIDTNLALLTSAHDMQDLRIYNRALSAEEIGILCEITRPGGPAAQMTQDTLYLKGEIKEA